MSGEAPFASTPGPQSTLRVPTLFSDQALHAPLSAVSFVNILVVTAIHVSGTKPSLYQELDETSHLGLEHKHTEAIFHISHHTLFHFRETVPVRACVSCVSVEKIATCSYPTVKRIASSRVCR